MPMIDFARMIPIILLTVLGSFALSLVATYAVRKCSLRVGFVDLPGGHKQHERTVALGGGIAIVLSVCIPIVLGTLLATISREASIRILPAFLVPHLSGIASKLPMVLGIAACAVVLFTVGLLDDRRPLGPVTKLAIQAAVALFSAWVLDIRAVQAIGAPLSITLTVLWIVMITNAFNFLDNMDGLSAGVAAIAAAIFAMTSTAAGQIFVPTMAWAVAGSLAGFLVFNFHPASIFMGDAGSLVIGYLLSVLTVLTTFYDPSQGLAPLGIVAPILVLAVPLYDVCSVVIHRFRAGDNPFKADRRHFSHRLVKRGMTQRGAVLTIYLATAATGLPAIVLPRVDWTGAVMILVQCLCVVSMIAILEHADSARVEGRSRNDDR